MDVTSLRAAPIAALHLRGFDNELLYDTDKAGQPDLTKPVRIHFYGPGTPEQAAAEARATERALRRARDNDGVPTPAAPDVRRAESAADLAAITHHFENLTYPPAEKTEGTDLFAAFYADPALGHLTTQAARFAPNWANFAPPAG